MKQLFKSKERFSIGLDIGTQTIKIVTLKFIKDKVELCDFYLDSYQPDLAQALKRITQSKDIKKANIPLIFRFGVNISISGPYTAIRYVNFPKMNNGELNQALKFEAQKHIPFSIDEINLDSSILKRELPGNKMLVMLAAAKKEFINQRLKIIKDAGINVKMVDIASVALINAFNFNYSQDDYVKTKTIALLNIGESMSNLNILEGGIPGLSRDIHIGGNNFTQKIQDSLGIDFKSAEELKLNPNKEKLDKVLIAVESVLSNLAQEVRASFDYYESQGFSSIVKIFLSGGGSLFTGIKDTLANILGIEVEYWNPLRQIHLSDSIDSQKIKSLSNRLAIAVGLALRK